eukprot:TRINITY_DN11022_c0_g2_i1.p1 TRINITY_DN11022_c0_g2~~TRINITY_DN11022_c0_g2_i1.p1  ORF type:complete len:595 (+),score=120.26 TRINITY_DN11022_c0_g2_i1:67-1851(+)
MFTSLLRSLVGAQGGSGGASQSGGGAFCCLEKRAHGEAGDNNAVPRRPPATVAAGIPPTSPIGVRPASAAVPVPALSSGSHEEETLHHAVGFKIHLDDHSLERFGEQAQRDFCDHVRENLGCDHVAVVQLTSGSVIVEAHAVGFAHEDHAREAAETIAAGRAVRPEAWGTHSVPSAPSHMKKLHRASPELQRKIATLEAASAGNAQIHAAVKGSGKESHRRMSQSARSARTELSAVVSAYDVDTTGQVYSSDPEAMPPLVSFFERMQLTNPEWEKDDDDDEEKGHDLERQLVKSRQELMLALNRERRDINKDGELGEVRSAIKASLKKLGQLPIAGSTEEVDDGMMGTTTTQSPRKMTGDSMAAKKSSAASLLPATPTGGARLDTKCSFISEDDVSSGDEGAVDARYSKAQVTLLAEKLKYQMKEDGMAPPKETYEEREKRLERERAPPRRDHKFVPTVYETKMKQHIDEYQHLMKDRLSKMGLKQGDVAVAGVSGTDGKPGASMDPAEVVKRAVAEYHKGSLNVGRYYPFGRQEADPDTEDQTEGHMEFSERCRLERFVRDLGEQDVDRWFLDADGAEKKKQRNRKESVSSME